MNVLFAVLTTGLEQPEWFFCDGSETVSPVVADDFTDQVPDRVVLVVSGEDVFLGSAESAVRSLDDFRTAALFQLEDELSQNVSQLHIAVGDREKDNPAVRPVAVTEHALMEVWLSNRLGLPESLASRMEVIPDTSLFEGDLHPFLFDSDGRVLVSDGQKTVAVSPALASDLVPALMQQLEMTSCRYIFSDQPVLSPVAVELSGVTLTNSDSNSSTYLNFIAPRLAANKGFDLCQAKYARKTRLSFNGGAWIGSGVLAVGVVVAWGITSFVSTWQLNQQTDKLYQSTVSAYEAAFPDEGRVADPRSRVFSKLRSQPSGGSRHAFVDLAAALFEGLEDIEGVELNGFSFNEVTAQLTATLRFSSYQDRDELKRNFDAKGLDLFLGGARQENGFIIGEAVLGGGL